MVRYKALKRTLVLDLDGDEITAANAASLSGKLCQMASGAIYTEDKSWIGACDDQTGSRDEPVRDGPLQGP